MSLHTTHSHFRRSRCGLRRRGTDTCPHSRRGDETGRVFDIGGRRQSLFAQRFRLAARLRQLSNPETRAHHWRRERPYVTYGHPARDEPALPLRRSGAISQYDGAIAYIDGRIGEIIDHLKRTGRYDNTHGESFGERDYVGHGNSPYQNLLRVGPMVKYPDAAKVLPRTVNEPVSLIDVFPSGGAFCGRSRKCRERWA